ncbi:kinase-like domain-containing protein [Mycena vulgaris]|nr:kinase-like domain-containing protein [Mycena vulgaris]
MDVYYGIRVNGLDGPDDPVAVRHPVPWTISPPSSPSLDVPTAAEQVHLGAHAHMRQMRSVLLPTFRNVVWCVIVEEPRRIRGSRSLCANGGQLLDFIIAHDRIRERVAPKFARQIASALDNCHRNNVVHRDLKIENILIYQTGNIKIVDFGLSNLYDPLLNAKLYTGPEVDIWSFGVVLYTLLCGKDPFEDESMPALHAKIKPQCKHLLSHMLVINPLRRASLSEISAHPCMVCGFSTPPSTHLPARTPLRTADIDPAVIARMAGFDFGADVEEVHAKLHDVLESDEYALAVLAHEHGCNGHATPEPPSMPPASPNDASKRRRFSGIDFYRRLRKRRTACHYVLCDAGGATTSRARCTA